MVYCSECGTNNEDDKDFCVKCGAALYPDRRTWRRRDREKKDDCFGLPHGGTIAGIIFGLIIILVGANALFGWRLDFGPLMIIIFGILVLAGAVYGMTRRRR
jgi:uncharacterized membrane protein YvbJ